MLEFFENELKNPLRMGGAVSAVNSYQFFKPEMNIIIDDKIFEF